MNTLNRTKPLRRLLPLVLLLALSGCLGVEQQMTPPATITATTAGEETAPLRTPTATAEATGAAGEETSPLQIPTATAKVTGTSSAPTGAGEETSPLQIPTATAEAAGAPSAPTTAGEETSPLRTPTAGKETAPLHALPRLALIPFVQTDSPITYLADASDGSGRLFLVEKAGRIRVIQDGQLLAQPFLDISDLVQSSGAEQGLLSVAFDPQYRDNGQFYVNYTAQSSNGGTVVARYKTTADPNTADPASGQTILEIPQPAPNHNGGQLQFGPDGYLYVGMGDGGSAGDPWGNAQNRNALLGKLLRLDVRGQAGYAIPPQNPFAGANDARPEVWAYGLRNPWRFSFDRQTGDLYIADVGQNTWEEVDFQPADSTGGQNYGWNVMEGLACYQAKTCDKDGKVLPVVVYGHDQGCSVTGGYVYRGQAIPDLAGAYLYSDYCSGVIWGLQRDGAGAWKSTELLQSGANVSSFGEDAQGELYVLDLQGQVYRLAAGK